MRLDLKLKENQVVSTQSEIVNVSSYLEKTIENSLMKLKNENIVVRCEVAQELGNLGNSAPPMVVIALLEAIKEDKASVVRCLVAEALGKLGNPKPCVLTALVKALEDKFECVQLGTIDALGKLGCFEPFIITALIKVSQTHGRSSFVRDIATEALKDWGVKEVYGVKRKFSSLEETENDTQKNIKPIFRIEQNAPMLFSFDGRKNVLSESKTESTQPLQARNVSTYKCK